MTYYQDDRVTLHHGDALDVLGTLPTESVDCIVTSPPYYGLRDYGVDGQYGLLAGCRPGGTVLDPFSGSGTTGMVSVQTGRHYIGIELNREYLDLSLRTRFAEPVLPIEDGAAS